MIPLEEARDFVLGKVQVLGFEQVGLLSARGQVTAEAITSSENVPPFDNTAVDGYAVLAADTQGATENSPVVLTVLESIAAGNSPKEILQSGECSKIMTGAPIPIDRKSVV